MQSLDLKTNQEEDLEKLPQDFSKPFSPPQDIQDDVPVDHPAMDGDGDPMEWYDEGRTGVSGVKDQEERAGAEEGVAIR